MIEILVLIATILYFIAFFIAQKRGPYFMAHIPIVLIAFVMDLYAIFLMYVLPANSNVPIHAAIAIMIIPTFLYQGYLGLTRNKIQHNLFAKCVFLPSHVWYSILLFFIQ